MMERKIREKIENSVRCSVPTRCQEKIEERRTHPEENKSVEEGKKNEEILRLPKFGRWVERYFFLILVHEWSDFERRVHCPHSACRMSEQSEKGVCLFPQPQPNDESNRMGDGMRRSGEGPYRRVMRNDQSSKIER